MSESADNQLKLQPAIADHCNDIVPAVIDWQLDDSGNSVPVSGEFGDVYFSHADGLAESRFVFIEGNNLPERLATLSPLQCFTIAELGFGTGLNLLALWQLWRQLRNTNPHLATARLHFITTEMHPIALADLSQILALWAVRAPELSDLIKQLLANYPTLIAGSHRLNFYQDNLIVDIWLGEASASLAKLATGANNQNSAKIDAWLLDGFAPSCNESLWAESIFVQMQRLSGLGSSAATYSCAGVVKRGLKGAGFEIKKIKGFGRKNEMLTAVMTEAVALDNTPTLANLNDTPKGNLPFSKPFKHTIIIGAGISGLMSAWSLANRGIKVTLLDKVAPLAGASGNPRALLAPKMTPIHHVNEHLHTIGYLYSCRLYRQFNDSLLNKKNTDMVNTAPVLEPTGALDLLIKANVTVEQIAHYPDDLATTLPTKQAQDITHLGQQDLADNLYLPQSGLVNPQALKEVILSHPLITYQQLTVTTICEMDSQIVVSGQSDIDGQSNSITLKADNAIICAAYESHYLDSRIFDCRKIRGQLSWFTPTAAQWGKLPKLPLKYSGYCAPFTAQVGDAQLNNVDEGQKQLLLGASFVRNDTETAIRESEHQISRDKLIAAIPELAAVISEDTSGWQARAGVRTQTPDYHPILGQVSTDSRIWTLTAMGAKGYAYAPICAEVLADMMLGDFAPLSITMLAKLSPNRSRLQTPLA